MNPLDSALYAERLLSHRDFVRSIAGSLLADPHAADDVTQDTLVAAIERRPKAATGLRSWLFTVARNFTRQAARGDARRRHREKGFARPERLPSTVEILEREALRSSVVQAVLRLPEPSRSAILLRFYEDKAPREIAAALGVPVETVRTRIKRGLERLRADLSAELARDGSDWRSALAPIVGWKGLESGRAASDSTTGAAAAIPAPAALGKVALWSAGAALVCAIVWIAARGAAGPSSPTIADVESVGATSSDVSLAAEPRPTGADLVGDRDAGANARAPLAEAPASPVGAQPTSPQSSTAKLRVSARISGSNAPVSQFECGFWRASDGLRIRSVASVDGIVQVELAFAPGTESDEFAVYASADRLGNAVQRVRLAPGNDASVEVMFRPAAVVAGTVVDPSGAPIAGAIVHEGTQIRMRGDEPFKPFKPQPFEAGPKTDVQGHFELEAHERYVSVWHADWSPKTVAVRDATRIVLEPRATIRGCLSGPGGARLAGVSVALDRARKTTTDERGIFEFENVEAGVRGLLLPEKRWVAVAVAPGQTTSIELSPDDLVSVELGLERGGIPVREPISGALAPLDRLGGLYQIESPDGSVRIDGVMPGRYLLLSKSGTTGFADIAGPSARVDVGVHALTVRGTPGTRVYLVPRGSSELVELLAGRAASQFLPASGEFRYPHVPAGRWSVGIDSHGIHAEVAIGEHDAEVVLDD